MRRTPVSDMMGPGRSGSTYTGEETKRTLVSQDLVVGPGCDPICTSHII